MKASDDALKRISLTKLDGAGKSTGMQENMKIEWKFKRYLQKTNQFSGAI